MNGILRGALAVTATLVLAVGVIGACGQVQPSKPSPSVTNTPTSAPETPPVTATHIPAVTGMSLTAASAYLAGFGLESTTVDFDGEPRATPHDEQWIVWGQTPTAGAPIASTEQVEVWVLPRGTSPANEYDLSGDPKNVDTDRVMIDFRGMTLDEAYSVAEELDLDVEDEDVSGDSRWVASRDNWVVVSQSIEPGSVASFYGVDLGVLKAGETPTPADASTSIHPYEARFFGKVTGFDEEDPRIVFVDGAAVSLAYIAPFEDVCSRETDTSSYSAIAARDALIPIGTEVMVVAVGMERFDDLYVAPSAIHVAESIDHADPFGKSVNEQLAAGGNWAPEALEVSAQDLMNGTSAVYEMRVDPGLLSPLESAYLTKVLAAGGTAWQGKVAGMGECATATEVMVAEEAAWRAEQEAEAERRRLEDEQNRVNLPPMYCRDGDGDGLCNE